MLDFSELPEDGTQFELLIREILFNSGHHVIWSGVGPDGGRDLIAREDIKSDFSRRSFSWLIQCKHFAKSKRSVGINDLDNIVDSCSQHGVDGYLLASSTFVSSAVVNRLEGIKNDKSKRLETGFWDPSIIERFLSTPENWGIAQRFMPSSAHAETWQISSTTHPNSWVANFRGHHIALSNRIGSSKGIHLSSIRNRVTDIDKLSLEEGHFVKIRAVHYDDKNGHYLYYLDYMVPHGTRRRLDVKMIDRALGGGYALEDGQIYDFDIRVVRYSSASDHYDPNHYDYYIPYTGSFLVGEPRSIGFERHEGEQIYTDYRQYIDDVDAARDGAYLELVKVLKSAPWLTFISASNAEIELVELTKDSKDLLRVFCDWTFHSENLMSCRFTMRLVDEEKCLRMFECLRQGHDVMFSLARNYIYVPNETQAKYEDDDYLHFLKISLGFCQGMTPRELRTTLNLYLVECANRLTEFIRRNRP